MDIEGSYTATDDATYRFRVEVVEKEDALFCLACVWIDEAVFARPGVRIPAPSTDPENRRSHVLAWVEGCIETEIDARSARRVE
ncbi:MAG: hypothetical protein KIT73_07255 [Burkholderiales bacterium]|nr:hypothetical protein [Burkholderiales bacterium]